MFLPTAFCFLLSSLLNKELFCDITNFVVLKVLVPSYKCEVFFSAIAPRHSGCKINLVFPQTIQIMTKFGPSKEEILWRLCFKLCGIRKAYILHWKIVLCLLSSNRSHLTYTETSKEISVD